MTRPASASSRRKTASPARTAASRPARRQPPKDVGRPPPPPTSEELGELVDIVDEHDRPLAVLPLLEARRQSLRHRAVLTLLYGQDHKLYLQRRSQAKVLYPGRWDLSSTGHVQAGESREEAAIRELREELGVVVDSLVWRRELPAGPDTGYAFLTIFSAGRRSETPSPNPDEISEGMFVDRDELAWLAAEYRESLTPGLVYCWEQGLLFPPEPPL